MVHPFLYHIPTAKKEKRSLSRPFASSENERRPRAVVATHAQHHYGDAGAWADRAGGMARPEPCPLWTCRGSTPSPGPCVTRHTRSGHGLRCRVLAWLLRRKREACHVRDAACQPGMYIVRLNLGRRVLWSCSQRRPLCSRQQSFRSFRPPVSACMSTLCVRQPYAYAVPLCAT